MNGIVAIQDRKHINEKATFKPYFKTMPHQLYRTDRANKKLCKCNLIQKT